MTPDYYDLTQVDFIKVSLRFGQFANYGASEEVFANQMEFFGKKSQMKTLEIGDMFEVGACSLPNIFPFYVISEKCPFVEKIIISAVPNVPTPEDFPFWDWISEFKNINTIKLNIDSGFIFGEPTVLLQSLKEIHYKKLYITSIRLSNSFFDQMKSKVPNLEVFTIETMYGSFSNIEDLYNLVLITRFHNWALYGNRYN